MSKRLREKDFVKTSELSLAAALVYLGYPLDCLEPVDSQRLNFVFLKPEGYAEDVDQIIQNFWSDNISVSPKRYFYILKELKSRVFAERRRV